MSSPIQSDHGSTAPALIITIDTEGDNVWAKPSAAQTKNATFLRRFQGTCEDFGFRPTWLVNHEMINSDAFRELAGDVIARGTAEIGMHLHAWDSPPVAPLTTNDALHHPYLIEYPIKIMREKIHVLTALIEDTLGTTVVSHRAGRWALDERYARLLAERGFEVDCSVTPGVSWRQHRGMPAGRGGADYRTFPRAPYWLDLNDIARPGESTLLEVPMTVETEWPRVIEAVAGAVEGAAWLAPLGRVAIAGLSRVRPRTTWLRPTLRQRGAFIRLSERIASEHAAHAEFMLHSSELMPGGSPEFPREADVEDLYADLAEFFSAASGLFRAATLKEFRDEFAATRDRACS